MKVKGKREVERVRKGTSFSFSLEMRHGVIQGKQNASHAPRPRPMSTTPSIDISVVVALSKLARTDLARGLRVLRPDPREHRRRRCANAHVIAFRVRRGI